MRENGAEKLAFKYGFEKNSYFGTPKKSTKNTLLFWKVFSDKFLQNYTQNHTYREEYTKHIYTSFTIIANGVISINLFRIDNNTYCNKFTGNVFLLTVH